MKVSIIIPVWNEEEHIQRLVEQLCANGKGQIADLLVIDGGSKDRTAELAACAGAKVIQAPCRGRAVQMNYGAQQATGELLYFVHGDTLPPVSYMDDLQQAVNEGFPVGCFRLKLDTEHPLLRINSFMTRFQFMWCRGGDQTLYVTREVFEELGGYRDDYIIMEEYDFIERAKERYPFKIIPKDVLASARKYEANSYFQVQFANMIVFNMFRMGFSQQKMIATYQRLIDWR